MNLLEPRIVFRHFLDRKAVTDAVGQIKVRGLKKGGYAVMQTTRRRIKKQGMAKPQLRVAKANPGMRLSELVKIPSISARERGSLVRRIREIEDPKHSSPGQSPFTHTGMFRNHILFSYDSTSQSVVVGQAMPKGDWLASLHEFGGTQQMRGYAWVPRYPGYRSPIIKFRRAGSKVNAAKWRPVPMTESRQYPPRPYMRPALMNKINDGTVVNSFRFGGG